MPKTAVAKVKERAGVHRIAELAGVSIGTVDRALHDRAGISKATRAKILGIAKKIDYSPHPAARTLSVGRTTFSIGVCIPEEIHFFYDQMRAGIFDEARRGNGLGLGIVYRPVHALGTDGRQQMRELINGEMKAVIVTPGNPRAITPWIDRAEARNIKVICITTDAPQSGRTSVVWVDPELSGRMAAELMTKFIGPDGRVAVITGMLSAEEHRLKAEAFRSAYCSSSRRNKIATVLEAHESERESYRKTRNMLADHPDLRGIYVSTVNCLPVCRALQEAGRANEVQLITTDLFPEMVPYLRSGSIRASIYQDPYLQGQTAIRVISDFLLNGTAIPKRISLNPAIVLQANLHLFREVQA